MIFETNPNPTHFSFSSAFACLLYIPFNQTLEINWISISFQSNKSGQQINTSFSNSFPETIKTVYSHYLPHNFNHTLFIKSLIKWIPYNSKSDPQTLLFRYSFFISNIFRVILYNFQTLITKSVLYFSNILKTFFN